MSEGYEASNGPATGQEDEKIALKNEKENLDESATADDQQGDFDTSKVKFINGGTKPEVQVDVEGKTKLVKENEFVGLSKEELMKFASDPFWIRTRWILLISFWLAWFAMLVAAVVIIVVAPKCPPRPALSWWQESTAYEIFPESFQDSNADGVGDLNGIHEQLNYFTDMNISALYFNSIVEDTDFKAIKPVFGTSEDFNNLRVAMHKKGIRFIVNFIPNHTGRNHAWFNESRKGADNDYSNYYVWQPGTTNAAGQREPPNNWLSVYGGSAWEFDDERQEYYLHHFLPNQPELNLTNPAVVAELNNVLTYWLEQGVDGFRVQNFAYLVEGDIETNEPLSGENVPEDDYDYLIHNVTTFQSAIFELATQWKEILQKFSDDEGRKHPRLLLVEADGASQEQIENMYNYNGKPGADMPMNGNLLEFDSNCKAMCIHEKIKQWTDVIQAGQTEKDRWSNWQIGTNDVSRMADRFGNNNVRAANMLLMTLPGTSFSYYGDEIGMHDVAVSWEQTQDPVGKHFGSSDYASHSRDPERTPMQWNGEAFSGFSTTEGKTYLPVADDYMERNVQTQSAHGSGITELEVFKSLAAIRQEPSLSWGIMEDVVVNNDILSYVRQAKGFEGYLIAINFGTEPTTVDFNAASPKFVPESGTVVTSTSNFDSASRMEDFEPGTEMTLKAVHLKPSEGFVVKFDFME